MHPEVITCTCHTGNGCRVPHNVWLAASVKLGRPVTLGEPYPNLRRPAWDAQPYHVPTMG